jgi:hypothetical protein
MLHENLNCNGLVVVMGKYLNSTRFVFHYMWASNISFRLLTAW